MGRKYTYRGFLIRIEQDGSGFRPYWCESLEHRWVGGKWSSTVEVAARQARLNIDSQYEFEADEFDRQQQRAATR